MTESNLLAHLKKLKQKGIDFIDKGTSESFLEEDICWYRGKICIPIDDVEEAVLGVAQQIPSILEKYICKTCGKFDAIKSGELNQCAITKSLGKCPYQHCLGEMLALLGAKEKK